MTGSSALSGPALKAARQAAGIRQAALARQMGISPNTLSQYETGRRPTPRWVSLALAAVIAEKRLPGLFDLLISSKSPQ